MKYFLFFLYFAYLPPISVLAAGEDSSVLNDASQVLHRFAESRNNLPSFIVKSHLKTTFTYPELKGKIGTSYQNLELRYDGNRCKTIQLAWGNVSMRDWNVKEEQADYFSSLWDGQTAFVVSKSGMRGGCTAKIAKKVDPGDYEKECSDAIQPTHVGEIMGYHWGDGVRIDELFLKSAAMLQLHEKQSNVRGVDCYVVKAVVPGRGEYTVWIDPVHDFHIARIQVQRESGDHIMGILLKQKCISKEMFEVLEFEKTHNAWFPKTCKWKREGDENGRHSSDEREISISTITLNPDHDALGSFLPDDIPNGAKVFMRAVSPDIEFVWQDGKALLKEDHRRPSKGVGQSRDR